MLTKYFLRYDLSSVTDRQTESDAYEPTMQYAQVGLINGDAHTSHSGKFKYVPRDTSEKCIVVVLTCSGMGATKFKFLFLRYHRLIEFFCPESVVL